VVSTESLPAVFGLLSLARVHRVFGAEALRAEVGGYFKGGVDEADEIVEQVTAQAELVAELLEGD
jgi:hypothetical protein